MMYQKKIYIAGHKGMVGSACFRKLANNPNYKVIGKDSNELDLKNFNSLKNFLVSEKPDVIINAAAKVGGIYANDIYPFEFISENIIIQYNLIKLSSNLNIKEFIFLGSSCIYPKFSKQPISEEELLKSPLEETNQWYAIAKISGVKMIEALKKQYNRNYVSLMPTNLYGPNDNFDLKTSHVLPSLIRKFHEAKVNNTDYVELWGTGKPFREFLHVDDLADAIIFCLGKKFKYDLYNIGYGEEISIYNLAELIKSIIGYDGEIRFNADMPDGTPRKLIDSSRINELGWKPKIKLEDGIRKTYKWYLDNRG